MLRHQGPYCPKLIEYLRNSADRYGAFVFFTYMYYPTCLGLPLVKSKAAFVPTPTTKPPSTCICWTTCFGRRRSCCSTARRNAIYCSGGSTCRSPRRVVGMGVEPTDPGPPDAAWPDLAERIGASRVLAIWAASKTARAATSWWTSFSATWRRPAAGTAAPVGGRRTLPIPDHPRFSPPVCLGVPQAAIAAPGRHRSRSSPFESLS